jgi:hypothetical protein
MNPVSWRPWLLVGWRVAPLRQRLAWAGAFVLADALVVLPVGLRDRAVGGEFLISTSQLGPHLYIGSHAGAIEDLREGPGPGAPLARAEGIRDAHVEGGLAVVTAGSGTYRFVSRPRPG